MNRRWSGSDRVLRSSTSRPTSEGDVGGGPTVAIGAAVDRLLRQRGMEDALILGRVAGCWEEIVGPEVARQVHPQFVRDGELVVSVDHPAWATELEMAGPAVLARLLEQLGDAAPKRLRVRVVPASRR